jgi:hypothetical protein
MTETLNETGSQIRAPLAVLLTLRDGQRPGTIEGLQAKVLAGGTQAEMRLLKTLERLGVA